MNEQKTIREKRKIDRTYNEKKWMVNNNNRRKDKEKK